MPYYNNFFILLDHYVDYNNIVRHKYEEILLEAVKINNLEITKYFVNIGANTYSSCMIPAINKNCIDIIEYILDKVDLYKILKKPKIQVIINKQMYDIIINHLSKIPHILLNNKYYIDHIKMLLIMNSY